MALKLAVISDTHGLLRPEVLETLKECDYILHAGDIDNWMVLEELRTMAPLYVVRGNNDWKIDENLPDSLRFTLGGVEFFMIHSKRDIRGDLGGAQVVVYGHSHRFVEKREGGRLWLNPGSCGRRRYDLEITMALLYIEDDGQCRVERIDLENK